MNKKLKVCVAGASGFVGQELIKLLVKHPHVEIIAGGGVTTSRDAKIYKDAGANHISLGSVCFTPWKIKKIINEETR